MTKGLPKGKRRRFYAFVDGRVAPPEFAQSARSRETLLLDAVDADAFDRGSAALENSEALALIRILSTRRRLREDYGLPVLDEGDWVELTLAEDPGSPRAWTMSAATGYAAEGSVNVRSIARLPDPERAEGGRGAAVAQKLAKACQLPLPRRYEGHELYPSEFLNMTDGDWAEIRVVDVGQASCNAIFIKGKPVGYFDAGAPVYWNQKSFSGRLCHTIPARGFVILSHWDFDHFALALRKPALKNLFWLAPWQPVGPNTLRFQKSLGDNLKFVFAPVSWPGFELRPGNSSKPNDRNGSGLGLRLELAPEVVVLAGDCPYGMVDPAVLSGATSLSVPHHGGWAADTPPPAQGLSRAVASYGIPNSYRHPSEHYLDDHASRGWTVVRTAAHKSNGRRRGYRRLYP